MTPITLSFQRVTRWNLGKLLAYKRTQFVKIIATKNPDDLVYVDESGIDNTEDYAYGYYRKGERFHAL